MLLDVCMQAPREGCVVGMMVLLDPHHYCTPPGYDHPVLLE